MYILLITRLQQPPSFALGPTYYSTAQNKCYETTYKQSHAHHIHSQGFILLVDRPWSRGLILLLFPVARLVDLHRTLTWVRQNGVLLFVLLRRTFSSTHHALNLFAVGHKRTASPCLRHRSDLTFLTQRANAGVPYSKH